jgi:hypothetical protein
MSVVYDINVTEGLLARDSHADELPLRITSGESDHRSRIVH